MKITDMITEWYKGCSCCNGNPIECNNCTLALIKAIDKKAFMDDVESVCNSIISEYGVFGVAMAAGHTAMSVASKSIQLRARNEHTNKKD